jgi:hypothetical protein
MWWHILCVKEINDRGRQGKPRMEVNPLTDVVTVYSSWGRGLGAWGEVLERRLDTAARERFDLYAMLIPYRVAFQD